MPSFCQILSDDCLTVDCKVTLYNDTFELYYSIEPCHDPVSVAFHVVDPLQHVDWSYTLNASAGIGVPGLTIGIPYVAEAGVFLFVDMSGVTSKARKKKKRKRKGKK